MNNEDAPKLWMQLGLTADELSDCKVFASIPKEVFDEWIRRTCEEGNELSAASLRTLCHQYKQRHQGSTMRKPICETSPIKRVRTTKADIAALEEHLLGIVEDEHPTTARYVFYRMVAEGCIEKTEAAYKTTVCRLLARLRKTGRLPYSWLADNTRWRMKPRSYDSLAEALDEVQTDYRRAVWVDQQDYVEVWCEKDAVANILFDVTSKWDVPLMVARGYASLSFLWSVAEDLKTIGKPSYIYYFGDHDPSGVDARRHVQDTIRELAPDCKITFRTAAVTPEQVRRWKLPTRPTKKSNTRAKKFKGRSIEVDAISPARLRKLVESCIVRHVDAGRYERLMAVEAAERGTLAEICKGFG